MLVRRGTAWAQVPPGQRPDGGPRWVVVAEAGLWEAARRHGVSERALAELERRDRLRVAGAPGPGADTGARPGPPATVGPRRPSRPYVDRLPGGEIVLTTPTLSYLEETHDVHTGRLTAVLCHDLVLMAEHGDAGVLDHAADRLTAGLPTSDDGVQQVLGAVLLSLAATAADVELGLGDAVAETERLVFSSDGHTDPVQQIYDLKREIAEARRALGPVTSVLPELLADAEETPGRDRSRTWLRRVQASVDRLDRHLDAHDALLGDMLSVHLTQVSVRQNEDMRKISAWAAIAAVPTLVAGIYGMNFRHMPELDWNLGYPLALLVMAGLCVGLYRLFRRSGWL